MHKYLALFLLVMVTITTAACSNTAEGAGRDMKGWGQWMEDTF